MLDMNCIHDKLGVIFSSLLFFGIFITWPMYLAGVNNIVSVTAGLIAGFVVSFLLIRALKK